jgi:predicted negative regulator of RcsB-dependent stress response
MFKKKQNIEDDFMNYNTEVSTQTRDGNSENGGSGFLGMIIKALTALVLLGILIVGGVFGYRFLQKDSSSKVVENEQKSIQTSTTNVDKANEQKMYTKDEMQAILQTMMAKLEKKQKENGIDSSKSTASEDEDSGDSLLSSLEDIQVDQMEDINLAVDLSTDNNGKKITTKSSDKNVDRYNKVVVKHSKNSYAQVDELSLKIGDMVKEMNQQPTTKSTYTKSITKEISVRENEMRIIVVKNGDSLSKIAKRAYGSAQAYDRILKANPDLIKNPNHIFIGQRLRVPVAEI